MKLISLCLFSFFVLVCYAQNPKITNVSKLKLSTITGYIPSNGLMIKTLEKKASIMRKDSLTVKSILKLVDKFGMNRNVFAIAVNPNPSQNSFDPRAENWMPPIRSQYGSTCYASAAIGIVEINYLRKHTLNYYGTPDIDLSEKQAINCTDGYAGGSPWDVLLYYYTNKRAFISEAKDPNDGKVESCPIPDATAKVILVNTDMTANIIGATQAQNIVAIKQAISKYGGVCDCMNATEKFKQIHDANVFFEYSTNNPPSEDLKWPNHCIVIIGWNDTKNAWLIRNSWGTGWGDKGYAWIDYGTNLIGRNAAFAETN